MKKGKEVFDQWLAESSLSLEAKERLRKEFPYPENLGTKKCTRCGKRLHPVTDSITGKKSQYTYRCACWPKNLCMSIG